MYLDNQNKLNTLINYIEEHLTENINYKELAKILVVNEYTLHRIFSFITNMSIPEYIRKRRMSLAANDLLKTNMKIIDVAVKYQYDSATSFSRAFKNFMGFNPTEIKNNQNFVKIFPILQFDNNFENLENIEYKEIENFSITLYGIKKTMKLSDVPKIAPIFWKEVIKQYPDTFQNSKYGLLKYNNIEATDNDESAYYIASKTPFDNSEKIEIKNKTYLVFKLNSRNPDKINEFIKQIYNSIILQLGYNIDISPDIEEYLKNDIYIYIPIKK